ncbi:MAG: 50S ribosomal protein L13 [Candidatus ainarchaeum sp.]|nr:50S ribosomal protein L13 [Candidatus ainarchaeum sp.]
MIIVDGNGMVFGRVASKISKELMTGKEVVLVNAEKILISGSPHAIIERYKTKRDLKNKANPDKSPRWPKVPERFVKRLIRGMLPWKKPRGKLVFSNLTVYSGIPKDIKESPVIFEECRPKNISKYISISKLCRMFGYEG